MFYEITQNKSGRPVLTVFYNSDARDWNQRIEQALIESGLTDKKVTIIAIPEGLKHALL